jgi:hypothetical protein
MIGNAILILSRLVAGNNKHLGKALSKEAKKKKILLDKEILDRQFCLKKLQPSKLSQF